MKINRETMLFEEITPEEYKEMQDWVEAVVLVGNRPHPHPVWMTEWIKTFGYTEDQTLLLMATALPQRVLLSLLYATQADLANTKESLSRARQDLSSVGAFPEH